METTYITIVVSILAATLSGFATAVVNGFRDAKKETIASYKQNPQYRAVYGTDLAVSLIDNLIKLFKK